MPDSKFVPIIEIAQLAKLQLFQDLDELTLGAIAERLEVLWLAAGEQLCRQGETADALYILRSGAMLALRELASGEEHRLGEIRAGETVGEMAMLSGRVRSATVRALRDSEILRFRRSDFDALLATEAASMLQLARMAFRRLEQQTTQPRRRHSIRAVALVPAQTALNVNSPTSSGIDVRQYAHELAEALARFGPVALLFERDCMQQSSAWFHQVEQNHHVILYVSELNHGEWFQLCARQCDELLWLANAETMPASSAAMASYRPVSNGADDANPKINPAAKSARLVLFHAREMVKGAALTWRRALGVSKHHHQIDRHDTERLARELTGFATGLVLGGGGARGFAHLGVVKALREHGMQIDRVAGTSIGAIVGAGIAMQFSDEELYQRYYRSFVQSNPLRDYTFPFIALVAGRNATARLKFESEERDITDSRLPFVCVSTNLTRGVLQEYREGPQWRALRASIAIPGILSPVFHNGEVFVDGGVMNNLPVDVMRRDLDGKIISVDIAGDYAIRAAVEESDLPSMWSMMWDWFKGIRPRPGILQILLRAGMVNSASVVEQNRQQSNILIKPPIESIELLDWRSFDQAIEIGYKHTVSLIEKGKID